MSRATTADSPLHAGFMARDYLESVPRSPRVPLLAALAGLIGLTITGALAYLVPVAHTRDVVTLQGFTALNRGRLTPLLDHTAHLADPGPYCLVGLAIVLVALSRRRPRVAAAVLVLLVGTGLTTEGLKQVLAHPRYDEWLGAGQIGAASWPSGHATASLTLALCAVLAAPARLRPVVAGAGALFAIAVAYAILALRWHFPSDVVGGFLVAGTWTAAAIAALTAAEARWPTRAARDPVASQRDAITPLALGAGAAAAVVAVALARDREAASLFVHQHTTFVVAAAGLAALATAVATGLARAVRA